MVWSAHRHRIELIANLLKHDSVILEEFRFGKACLSRPQSPFIDVTQGNNILAHDSLAVSRSLSPGSNHSDIEFVVR